MSINMMWHLLQSRRAKNAAQAINIVYIYTNCMPNQFHKHKETSHNWPTKMETFYVSNCINQENQNHNKVYNSII